MGKSCNPEVEGQLVSSVTYLDLATCEMGVLVVTGLSKWWGWLERAALGLVLLTFRRD